MLVFCTCCTRMRFRTFVEVLKIRSAIISLVFIHVIFVTLATTPAYSAMPDVDEVILAFEQELSKLQPMIETCYFEGETKMEISGAIALHAHRRENQNVTFIRDKDSFDIVREVLHFDDEGNVNPKNSTQSRQIIDGVQGLLRKGELNQPPDYMILAPGMDKEEKERVYARLGEVRTLDGYLPGDGKTSLVGILRSSSSLRLRDTMDFVDGHKVYVVEAKDVHGEYALWLDPEYGFMPRRITVRKSDDDLYYDQPLNSPPPNVDPKRAYYPVEPLNEYSVIVDSIKIEEIKDVFLLTAAKVKKTLTYSSGKVVTFDSSINRTNFDFAPDFETLNAFVMDAPDGTRVFHKIFTDTPLEWLGGKTVPVIDADLVDMIDSVTHEIKGTPEDEAAVIAKKGKPPLEESLVRSDTSQDSPKMEEETTPESKHASTSLAWLGILTAFITVTVAVWLVLRRRRNRNIGHVTP